MDVIYYKPAWLSFGAVDLIFFFFFISAVMAAASIANIVKSSLGPVGLDKMLVDDIGVSTSVCYLKGK